MPAQLGQLRTGSGIKSFLVPKQLCKVMEQNRTGSPISNFWTHCYVLLIAYLFIILFYFIDLFIFFAYCFFQDVFALEMGKLLNSQLSDYHLAITMWSKYGQNIGGILNLQDA